jgi:hypothetical protein
MLHNMLLKENGYLELTKVLRKNFALVPIDGLWGLVNDDTPDEAMELEELCQCPIEKAELAAKWKSVMEGLMKHYEHAN